MYYLLNKREQQGIKLVKMIHLKRFGQRAEHNENLFVFLGDNVKTRLTWSGVSNKIPTYRTNSGKFYHLSSNTWLTSREKLASLGFPVTPNTAISMGVPIMPVTDTRRAATIAGNSFHFGTAAVIQLLALSCFKGAPWGNVSVSAQPHAI